MKQQSYVPLGISIVADVVNLGENRFKLDYNRVDLPVVVEVQMCKNNRLLLSYRSKVIIGSVVYTSEHRLLDPVYLHNTMDRHCTNLYYEALEKSLKQANVAWANWN